MVLFYRLIYNFYRLKYKKYILSSDYQVFINFKENIKIFCAELICKNPLNCRFAFLISNEKTGDQKKLRSIRSCRK